MVREEDNKLQAGAADAEMKGLGRETGRRLEKGARHKKGAKNEWMHHGLKWVNHAETASTGQDCGAIASSE